MNEEPTRADLPDEIGLGEWTFRPREGELARDGERLRLEPKVAALLAYLVRGRARLVTREELLSAVWPDTVVAPIALARGVSELRRALQDDVRAPRYIRTFPKRGYRFVGPVATAAAPAPFPSPAAPEPFTPAPATPRRPRFWPAAVVAVALVLGGRTGSDGPPAPAALTRTVPAAAVALRPTSEVEDQWRACRLRLVGASVEHAVAVQRCLETVLERAPGFFPARITLISALAMQTELGADDSRARAAELQVERLGREHPDSALVHGMSSLVYTTLRRHTRARAEYEQALRLDPDSRAGLTARALALSRRGWRDQAALANLKLASLDGPPISARVNLGVDLLRLGYDAQARHCFQGAVALDAREAHAQIALANLDYWRGQREAARQRLARLVREQPSCQMCLLAQAAMALQDADVALAGSVLDRAARWPGSAQRVALLRARVALARGDRARVPVWLDLAEAGAREALASGDEGWAPLHDLAVVAALRGDAAQAAHFYRRATAAGADLYRSDRGGPLFARVLGDPVFAAALDEARAVFEARRRRLEDLRLPERAEPLALIARPTRTAD